jgi:hypothetical protein
MGYDAERSKKNKRNHFWIAMILAPEKVSSFHGPYHAQSHSHPDHTTACSSLLQATFDPIGCQYHFLSSRRLADSYMCLLTLTMLSLFEATCIRIGEKIAKKYRPIPTPELLELLPPYIRVLKLYSTLFKLLMRAEEVLMWAWMAYLSVLLSLRLYFA